MEDKVNIIKAGALVTDTSPIDQPKDTVRFALNATNESSDGDRGNRIVEESNAPCYTIPTGFIPIGSIYIGDETTLQFFAHDDGSTIFALLDRECNLTIVFNDSLQEAKLGLTVSNQVQGIYRLRLGCEKCVYFTDDNIKPQYFNINKPQDFKAADDTWDISKFLMIKEYNDIPKFKEVSVIDSGGNNEPGSYNVTIQYVDEGLNPSEWITTSQVINLYNDSVANDYLKIKGSINSDEEYLNFPTTTKSIKVVMDNLDSSYPYYRLGFLEATVGTGKVNSVKYTELIPTTKDFFIFSGDNFVSTGTPEEVAFFTFYISKVRVIEQVENRATLHKIQGKRANFCNLQKYASRIKADVQLKKVILNNIVDPRNNKNPTMQFGDMITGGLGEMPGEIISYGIVYVFADGSTAPVCHIPGKSPLVPSTTVYSPGTGVVPMSNVNNVSTNNKYIDNDTCTNNIFWGLDAEGNQLEGAFVRHHRFPSRSDLNIPLFEEESTTGENEFTYYKLKLDISGTITLPEDCPLDPETGELTDCAPSFSIRVTFTVDGLEEVIDFLINPSQVSNPYNETVYSNLFTSNDIVVTLLEESEDGINYVTVTEGVASPKGAVYVTSIEDSVYTSESKIYSTQIMGIKFSGIDIPPIEETNGEEVVGYYIVRNERTENEKTVLDSGVLIPTMKNDKYTSHGLLNSEVTNDKINTKVVALIHPEHKFKNKEYINFDYIKQEGNFNITKTYKSRIRYNDVLDGTSYDSGSQKDGNDDGQTEDGTPNSRGLDGWCLKVILRDNNTEFIPKKGFTILKEDVDENFYLNALESRNSTEGTEIIYNIAADNKIGIVTLKEPFDDILTNKLPYVIIGRESIDPYSNYRLLPYYKISLNVETGNTSTVFGGDTYVAPIRYCNTVFWENRVAERAGRTSAWKYIAGSLLVIVGAALAFFTAGASTTLIVAGVSLIGAGALFISSGIKMDAIVKAYGEDYNKGLRETALDDFVKQEYRPTTNETGKSGPSDDEIQWIGDAITDLWFETSVNIPLRNGMTSDLPTYLAAPGVRESGSSSPEVIWEYFGKYYQSARSRYPTSKLEYHVANKLLVYDSERNDSRSYIGTALGEYYNVNPDYERYNKEKLYYHLALEYDCCSECQEDFPHRVHYSEQSYQEELTDNFRVFLPNNYRDIEGETGEITDAYRFGDRLFIQTEDALWFLPNTQQERVTNDIVSFIGTGGFFAVPPKKIVDGEKSSAGSLHRWARIKTKNGIFFPSYREKKWYLFDGQKLTPISDLGNYSFFKNSMNFKLLDNYYSSNRNTYPYFNNPSNPIGVGFLSTYDTEKERLLVTKKDFVVTNLIEEEGYELCNKGADTIIFRDIQETIFNKVNDGYTYLGIDKCRLKFSKVEYETVVETREILTTIPSEAIIIPFFDTTSMGIDIINNISATLNAWFPDFKASVNGGDNDITFINPGTWNRWGTEAWVQDPAQLTLANVGVNKDIVLLVFVDESNDSYHGSSITVPMSTPTVTYTTHLDNFVTNLYPQFKSFLAINYPIVRDTGVCEEYLIHAIGAIEAKNLTLSEVNALSQNPYFTTPQWNDLKTALQANSYTGLTPLREYGWLYKENRIALIDGNPSEDCEVDGTSVITPCTFTQDIEALISNIVTVEEIMVEVLVPVIVYEYIEGEPFTPITLDNGWTMSYSLKESLWVSYHSYIPDYYMYTQDKFYSWKNNLGSIYRHNIKNSYRIFYNEACAFIIEIVDNSNPLQTKITESISFHTEAKKFDSVNEEFLNQEEITFNKLLVYNSRQVSGVLDMINKNNNSSNYLLEQTVNNIGDIGLDITEKDWSVNELRDIRVDNTKTMFKKDLASLQADYYIDKVVNIDAVNFNKNWQEMESFRDKYLVIRLIFDTFTDIRLISNFILPNKNISEK